MCTSLQIGNSILNFSETMLLNFFHFQLFILRIIKHWTMMAYTIQKLALSKALVAHLCYYTMLQKLHHYLTLLNVKILKLRKKIRIYDKLSSALLYEWFIPTRKFLKKWKCSIEAKKYDIKRGNQHCFFPSNFPTFKEDIRFEFKAHRQASQSLFFNTTHGTNRTIIEKWEPYLFQSKNHINFKGSYNWTQRFARQELISLHMQIAIRLG